MDTHTHTRTHSSVPATWPFLDCLFGYRKRARACVYLIVHKKEVTQALNLRVCHLSACVCVLYTVCSYFKIKLGLLLMLVRNYGHQQEARRTDNELNRDSPFLTEVAGNRFAFGYQMTNWTMFLHDSLKN